MKQNESTTKTLGRLYVFEGPDDVGKTTLSHMLGQHFSDQGHHSELLSFPGNERGTLGELIYRFYHNPKEFGVSNTSSVAMQLAVTAAHVDVIETRIKPLIKAGVDVVLDRFWWSTWVYSSIESVTPHLRDKMIDLELETWEGIQPATVFLVLRQEALCEQPSTQRWHEIVSLYKELYEDQRTNVPVELVLNDGTITQTFQRVVSSLG